MPQYMCPQPSAVDPAWRASVISHPWKAGGTTDADGVGEWDHHPLTEARQDFLFHRRKVVTKILSGDQRDGLSPYLRDAATSPGSGRGCVAPGRG